MSRPLVVYTHRVSDAGPALLRETCDVIVLVDDDTPSVDELARLAVHADALCFFVPDLIDAALIARLERVKILASFGKGYDNVDLAAATARGIWVTNVPHALTDATADLTMGLLLGLARKIALGDALVRSGVHPGWHPSRLMGTSLGGMKLGIIGFGQIGQAIARRAAGFGMRIMYTDIAKIPGTASEGTNATEVSREKLLASADIIALGLPLTPQTRHAIDAASLARCKRGALLINTARGSVVDERAVADALEAGILGGYAADVFELEDRLLEDRPSELDPRLIAMTDRTLFTPHIGTALADARTNIARDQAMNVLRALAGERPPNALNALPR